MNDLDILLKKYLEMQVNAKSLKESMDSMKQQIKDLMHIDGLDYFENDFGLVKITESYPKRLNQKALKEAFGEDTIDKFRTPPKDPEIKVTIQTHLSKQKQQKIMEKMHNEDK